MCILLVYPGVNSLLTIIVASISAQIGLFFRIIVLRALLSSFICDGDDLLFCFFVFGNSV